MDNHFQYGSSGASSPNSYHILLPQLESSYTAVVSEMNSALATPSIRSNRVSYLLNPVSDSTSELYSSLPSSRSPIMDTERNDHSLGGRISSLTSRPPHLPSFSRAFEMFMPRGGMDAYWTAAQDNLGFFTPSYLKGSSYIAKLEDVHRTKQAHKESRLQSGGGVPAASPDSPRNGKAPASHLGMTFNLIERSPTVEHASEVPPLPTRWNKDDKTGALEVSANGLEVKYNSALRPPREQDHEISGIRADHPMPPQAGIYYFEVTLLSKRRDETTTVCIGFATKNVALARPVGWEQESWGYHGDDGEVYAGSNVGKKYKDVTFSAGDVVGCGVNFRTGHAFFTKNGANLGPAFRDLKGKLYPVVGIKKGSEVVRANFGQSPFVFKIDQIIEKEQGTIKKAIAKTSIERLASSRMSETEFIQQLVLQFLQHDGYVETAREFAKEIHAEQQALNSDTNIVALGLNIKDDDDAHQRQRIRRAILEGDIDRALILTKTHYTGVLENNQHVYFKLRCRKFIEMVRQAAEYASSVEKGSNGHSYEDIPNEMDVDEGSVSDTMDDDPSVDPDALLRETIKYGQDLQAEFRDDTRPEVSKTLNDIFALLAYTNPLEVKEIAPMLDGKGRVAVAEELNSAILSSLGKSSRSALENLYGQTSVLLDYLREDGGPGSLVSIQSLISEIPRPQSY